MPATTVLAATLCRPGPPAPGWVAITDGVIDDVGDTRPPGGAIELGRHVLAPGYIDLQVNGVGDVDFMSADADAWDRAFTHLAAHGVTSCCPTIVSAPLAAYDAILGRARAAHDRAHPDRAGSAMLGVHLEGPFLGGAPGAHERGHVVPADLAWLRRLLHDHPQLVRIVTLAPEADPGFEAIRMLDAAGVLVALGHSLAPYADAIAATDAGARLVTHLFNAMGPLHHREPGLAGAALDDDRLTPTLIADLVHVHPAALRLAIGHKPNIALVSDAVSSPDDPSLEAVRLADGRLAGATTMLDRAVANVINVGASPERAIAMASSIPAGLLGLSDRGRIEPGMRADLVALDPSSYAADAVWIGGDRVRASTAA